MSSRSERREEPDNRINSKLLRKSRRELSSRSTGSFQNDPVPLALEHLDGTVPDRLGMPAVVIVNPELLIGRLPGQEVPLALILAYGSLDLFGDSEQSSASNL